MLSVCIQLSFDFSLKTNCVSADHYYTILVVKAWRSIAEFTWYSSLSHWRAAGASLLHLQDQTCSWLATVVGSGGGDQSRQAFLWQSVAVFADSCKTLEDALYIIILCIYIYRTLRNYNIAIQHNMFYHVIPHAASCRFLVAVPSMAMGTVSLCTVLQDVPLRPTVKHERFQVPLEVHYCAFTCIYGNLVSAPSEWIGECYWSRLPDCGFWVAGFSPELWASTQLLLDTGDFLNGIGLWKPLDSWRFPDQMEC